MTKKILLIVRASTEQQEIESQKKELIQYVAHFGYSEEQCVIIAVAGASARKKNEKYLQMLEDVKTAITEDKEIEAVGLWSLDRLGRVDDSLIEMKNWFITHKIQLICKSPSLVLLDEDGSVNGGAEIAYGVFSSLVKQQTEDLFNKWQRGKKRNSEESKCNGNKTQRYGYKLDENNYVIPNTDKVEGVNHGLNEVELVNYIYRLYASGEYSIETIFTKLRDEGYKYRNGKPLSYVMINNILKTTAYIGYTDDDQARSHRKFPPIVSEDLYNAVKKIRDNKAFFGGKSRETRHFNLCTGLIHCYKCGCAYVAVNRQYVCLHKAHTQRYPKRCDSRSINIKVADKLAWSVVTSAHYLHTLQNFKAVEKELEEEYESLLLVSGENDNKIKKAKDSFERAKELFILGDITKTQYEKAKSKQTSLISSIEAQQATIKARMDDIAAKLKEGRSIENWKEDAKADLSVTDELSRQKLAKKHIKNITVERVDDDLTKINITSKGFAENTFVYYYSPKRRKTYIKHCEWNGSPDDDSLVEFEP